MKESEITKAKSINLCDALAIDMAREMRRRALFSNDLAWKQTALWVIKRLNDALTYDDSMVTSSAICLSDALSLLNTCIDQINKIPSKKVQS